MEQESRQREILITIAGTALAAVFFGFAREPLGDYAAIVSVVPVGLLAFFFGTRPGLLAATVAFPFNTFLLDFFFQTDESGLSVISTTISLSLVGVAWLLGRFHKMRETMATREREHRRAQTALETSEERMRGFLNASPDVIFRIGPSGRLLEIHGELRFGVDLSRDQYLFRPLNEIMPKTQAAAILMASAEARSKGNAMTMVEFTMPQGIRTFQVSVSPGGGTDVVGIARDVTEFLETEEQRRMMEMMRAKDEFVAGVAHELRTPLAGVLGLSQTLRNSPETLREGEADELLDLIADQSRRISYRIDDLIVAARAEVGRLSVEPEPVDLHDLATEVVRDLGENVVLRLPHVRALADRERLGHILRNLIGNALEHGGSEVIVTASQDSEMVTTHIMDNGRGIGAHSKDVFEPYTTVEQAETQPDRVGVGLTVAKQLANLMRGDVVYRREDGLTIFDLTLPVA